MKNLLAIICVTSLLFLPAGPAWTSGLNELEKSLQGQSITGTAPDHDLTVKEMVKTLNEAVDRMLLGGDDGKVSAEELEKINELIKESTEAIRKLEALGQDNTTQGTATTRPPATTPPAGTSGTATTDKPKEEKSTKGTVQVNTRLNIRDGVWGNILGKLTNGTELEVIGQEGEWLKVKWNGKVAYVYAQYVKVNGDVPYAASEDTNNKKFTGRVHTPKGGSMNVRSAPWGPIIGSLNNGDKVEVKKKDGDWYVITFNGKQAFVHNSLIEDASKPATPPPVAGTPPPAGNPPSSGGFVFPVGVSGNGFSDTWGAPRSGGRTHKGTDIFNKANVPLVACRTGKMGKIAWNSLGGNSLHVIGNDGVDHYYAHLSRYADLRPGVPVNAGTVVGYMGGTGNANGVIHLHFGMYRNGNAFNPYPILRPLKY